MAVPRIFLYAVAWAAFAGSVIARADEDESVPDVSGPITTVRLVAL